MLDPALESYLCRALSFRQAFILSLPQLARAGSAQPKRTRLWLSPPTEQEAILSHTAAQNQRPGEDGDSMELAISLSKERRSDLITAAITGQIRLRASHTN
jgi:hypothetical protein